MVNINGRLQQIKVLVDEGKYFTINRARQYGKTTTLRALAEMLRDEYYVVLKTLPIHYTSQSKMASCHQNF